MSDAERIDVELAARAFSEGFKKGADPLRARGGHTIDPKTHEHWRAGFEAGRRAAESAITAYREQLKNRSRGKVS